MPELLICRNGTNSSEIVREIVGAQFRSLRHTLRFAGVCWTTLACVEKVRPQFLSLRQLTDALFSRGDLIGKLTQYPESFSNLSSGLLNGRIVPFFSERPASLRTYGLRPPSTVLEIQSF